MTANGTMKAVSVRRRKRSVKAYGCWLIFVHNYAKVIVHATSAHTSARRALSRTRIRSGREVHAGSNYPLEQQLRYAHRQT